MAKFELPSTVVRDAAWLDEPPDPLDDPQLYDGLIGRRILGYLIDVAVLMMLAGGLWLLNMLTLFLLSPVILPLLGLLPLAYHSFFVGRNGATPGMNFLDLEVRSWTGGPPDYIQAIILTVLFYLSLTLWPVLIFALFNERRRMLHDYLAGTITVRRSRLAAEAPGGT